MRVLILICAVVSSFCLAIPLEFPPDSVIHTGKEIQHMDTPHRVSGSLRDDAYIGDTRVMMPDSEECLLSTKIKERGDNGDGNTHRSEKNCFSGASKFRIISRKHLSPSAASHDSSFNKGHKVHPGEVHSEVPSDDANGDYWFKQSDYRRSPLLGLQPGDVNDHSGTPHASTNTPRVEPTQTSLLVPHRTERLKERPTHSQGGEDNHADRWGGQNWDWKQ